MGPFSGDFHSNSLIATTEHERKIAHSGRLAALGVRPPSLIPAQWRSRHETEDGPAAVSPSLPLHRVRKRAASRP